MYFCIYSLPKKTRHSENPPWFWIAHFLYYIVFVIMKVPQLVDFLKDGTKISNATWGCLVSSTLFQLYLFLLSLHATYRTNKTVVDWP